MLLGRRIPPVRPIISVTAGVLEAPPASYRVLTAMGSAICCFGLAGSGWAAGERRDSLHHAFRYAAVGVVLGLLAAAMWLLLGRRRRPCAAT